MKTLLGNMGAHLLSQAKQKDIREVFLDELPKVKHELLEKIL